MTVVTTGDSAFSTDRIDLSDLGMGGTVIATTSTLCSYYAHYAGMTEFSGLGLVYDTPDSFVRGVPKLLEGVVTGWRPPAETTGENISSIEGFSIPAPVLSNWLQAGYPMYAFNIAAFAGDDSMTGGALGDTLRGDAGDDTILGGGGDDVLDGGTGARPSGSGVLPDPTHDGSNYLRGGDGNDVIQGGAGFDDINGNQGSDTVHGGAGDDWVVGGKDDDVLFGDDGNDIVYGNLGADACDGGAGNDIVRGGQGDDSLIGGAGDDWLSGDRGNDTLSGGTGADVFHSFGDAGLDRVLDFNPAEGDRVQLDPGTTYTVSQAGADVVIAMSGGAQMVLGGVSMATLPEGWIVAT